jgi:hypothetical protein
MIFGDGSRTDKSPLMPAQIITMWLIMHRAGDVVINQNGHEADKDDGINAAAAQQGREQRLAVRRGMMNSS